MNESKRILVKAKRVTSPKPNTNTTVFPAKQPITFLTPKLGCLGFQRYGYLGAELAESLQQFSFDLVGLVAQFALEFRLIRTVGSRSFDSAHKMPTASNKMAIDKNGNIYALENHQRLCRYDTWGQNRVEFSQRLVTDIIINPVTNELVALTLTNRYSAEYLPQEVILFNSNFEVVTMHVVSYGTDATPYTGLVVDDQGNVFVKRTSRKEMWKGMGVFEDTVYMQPILTFHALPSTFSESKSVFPIIKLSLHHLQVLKRDAQGDDKDKDNIMASVNVDEEFEKLPEYPFLNRHAWAMHPDEHSIYVSMPGQHVAKVYVL